MSTGQVKFLLRQDTTASTGGILHFLKNFFSLGTRGKIFLAAQIPYLGDLIKHTTLPREAAREKPVNSEAYAETPKEEHLNDENLARRNPKSA